MNKFSVIEVYDLRWSAIVNKSKQFDFYHSQSYHLLEKENRPVLLVAFFNNDFMALPLVIRAIPNTSFFDCTSVYGYCGLISSIDVKDIPSEKIIYFKKQLLSFFESNAIVSVFSRLHPLISTDVFFNNFGLIKNINKTVAIDLRLSSEKQRAQYRKSYKLQLNQLRRKGFEVVNAQTKEDIDAFIDIYRETMKRVGASEKYFFSHNYFYIFLENKGFESKLLLAKKEGEIVAGAIFTIANNIMQYHLAGTAKTHLKERPMKLIVDEARLLGNELGLDFLHLGGGVGGNDEDSLFYFKSGFSDYRCQYKIWQTIVDYKKYNELIEKAKVDVNSTFFPLYRAFLCLHAGLYSFVRSEIYIHCF
ncbi:GNAT family N-acetyltransferase [Flavobacterium sp. ZB4P13]|uniref:GNAT family N-acetyltransferase n=1 Tax=Flavobacterium sp. ZB4P13 TaxID=3401728 RepID=UPI003AABF2FE